HQGIQKNMQESLLIEIAVSNMLEEIVSDSGHGSICHLGQEKYALILTFGQVVSTAKVDGIINQVIQRAVLCMQKFLNLSVSFSIGPRSEALLQIADSFTQAEENLSRRFYAGKSCVLRCDTRKSADQNVTGLSLETEQKLAAELRLPQMNLLLESLEQLFDEMEMQQVNYINFQITSHDLMGILIRAMKEYGIEAERILESKDSPHARLSQLETFSEVHNFFILMFTHLHEAMHKNPEHAAYSDTVKKAIAYIGQHYTEEIRQEDVAQAVNISRVYFCKLFKKETETSFTDFVCSLRLEKAKLLLQRGNTNLKNVANDCGFRSYAYFFHVFKQNIGQTPGEFIVSSVNQF
ncbi:MAG: AraC family transcriptional regulator, partial [Ruthenibacterium sp.]